MGTFTALDLQGTTSFFVVGVETAKYAKNCLRLPQQSVSKRVENSTLCFCG